LAGTTRPDHARNQDATISLLRLGHNESQHLFAICDGHGEWGSEISGAVKACLPGHLVKSLPIIISSKSEEQLVRTSLMEAMWKMENQLKSELTHEIEISGTTC
jgi:serine/threonine protein phosphatase PrpC